MQSGKWRSDVWILEFEPHEAKRNDPLMGWVGSGDTLAQVKLRFSSKAEAETYARHAGLDAEVIAPNPPKLIKQNYANRFAFDRVR